MARSRLRRRSHRSSICLPLHRQAPRHRKELPCRSSNRAAAKSENGVVFSRWGELSSKSGRMSPGDGQKRRRRFSRQGGVTRDPVAHSVFDPSPAIGKSANELGNPANEFSAIRYFALASYMMKSFCLFLLAGRRSAEPLFARLDGVSPYRQTDVQLPIDEQKRFPVLTSSRQSLHVTDNPAPPVMLSCSSESEAPLPTRR